MTHFLIFVFSTSLNNYMLYPRTLKTFQYLLYASKHLVRKLTWHEFLYTKFSNDLKVLSFLRKKITFNLNIERKSDA